MVKKIYFSAFLIMVVLSSSIYFLMPDKVKIDIGKTNTKYSVWENDSWVLAATEYVNLYDGSKKMRAKSRELIYWNDSKNVYTQRKSVWKDDIVTIQTYIFEKDSENVEDFPEGNKFECFNCEGKIVHYEIRDILYEGETKVIESPFSFGHNMKIEWSIGNYYSKVFQQKSSDKIIIKYKPKKYYESYNVRLFDPVWNLSNVNYTGDFFNTNTEEFNPTYFYFKNDGLNFYIVGETNDTVYQYNLSTAGNVSTASYSGDLKDVSPAGGGDPVGLFFRPNGITMYVMYFASEQVHQFNLSSPWVVSTAGSTLGNFDTSPETGNRRLLFFSTNGSLMYIGGEISNILYQYTLSTPWDVTSASYDSISYDYSENATNGNSIYINSDGNNMFITAQSVIYNYELSTPWNIGTASYTFDYHNISDESNSSITGLSFNTTGENMYVLDSSLDDTVFQYSLVEAEAVTQCSNTIDTDWLITDAQTCDNQELNIGTGKIVISTGNLTLINSGNVTASGLNITQDGEKVFIFDNSNLIII